MYKYICFNDKYLCKKFSIIFVLLLFLVIFIAEISVCLYEINLARKIDQSNYFNITDYNKTDKDQYDNVYKEILIFNQSLCDLISHISIRYSNKVVTVCMYEEDIRIDIREFYGNKPSIKGIWFSLSEWKEFTRILFDVNTYVNYQQLSKDSK